MQQIVCIANINLKKLVQAIFTLCSYVFETGSFKSWKFFLKYFFQNLGDGESHEDDKSDFEILLDFEPAIVEE